MTTLKTMGRWMGLAGALVLSLVSVTPAFAAGQVTQVINCGGSGNSLSASITDMTLTDKNFATVAQDSIGNLNLAAVENGCDAKGWKVTIQASAWAKQDGGTAIPANAFSLTQTNNPGYVSGQVIDVNNGPKLVNETGTLEQSRKVLNANAGYGVGSYTQVLGVKLVIPAVTLPGTYKTTITTTMTTAP
jgi:hypothetical protein